MAFHIGFERTRGRIGLGRITIGDFTERFESCFCAWGPKEYIRHWRLASQRLADGKGASLFVTSAHEAGHEFPTFLWPAWRVESEVIFLSEFRIPSASKPFCLDQPFRHVQRTQPDFSDRCASQWRVSLAEISAFLRMSSPGT